LRSQKAREAKIQIDIEPIVSRRLADIELIFCRIQGVQQLLIFGGYFLREGPTIM
jgi:hypothetical protein